MTGDIISQLGGRKYIENAYTKNLKWIVKSFTCHSGGSAAWSSVIGTYTQPYLETTGYLIPTLLEASDYFNNTDYVEIAELQEEFFAKHQNNDGSFFRSINNRTPIVFDTGQILLGLCHLYDRKPSQKLLSIITQCSRWLYTLLSEDGRFANYNYGESQRPAYYSRIYWPMLLAKNIVQDDEIKKIKNGVINIIDSQNKNLSFPDWGFDKKQMALTHTIVYTLRGLWECGHIIKSQAIISKVESTLTTLCSMIINQGQFCATYNYDWEGNNKYICSAGNAQLALLLIKSDIDTSIKKDVLPIILRPLLTAQRKFLFNKGAIPSSIPIYGEYQRWRYTNWTQKFFCDALHALLVNQ